MKIIAPDYYTDFACIAGRCRHTCCRGWEIDIDSETLQRYGSVKGAFGERLRHSIAVAEEGACFRLDAQERCPFLNDKGLCDIIIHLGKDALCQVCADHPRYRAFFSDRVEIGLGLCCEAAAALILKHEAPVRLIVLDGEEENCSTGEKRFFAFRDSLLHIAQNRPLPLSERMQSLEKHGGIRMDAWPPQRMAALYLPLERLDPRWSGLLIGLQSAKRLDIAAFQNKKWDIAFEQFLVYMLYRHLSGGIETGDLRERVAFALISMHMIYCLCALQNITRVEDMAELVRMYSSEIEYSDENITAILEILHAHGDAPERNSEKW